MAKIDGNDLGTAIGAQDDLKEGMFNTVRVTQGPDKSVGASTLLTLEFDGDIAAPTSILASGKCMTGGTLALHVPQNSAATVILKAITQP